ncbi:MAG TPA: FG-GAP-like repeat-containing protein, partial [Vicinamibacteria bacterium]|nr:FG-GAP-like repeat-containing protein [Vicinamibacteria bacterium]
MKRAVASAALLALAAAAPTSREARERAYRANNRGVALLEQFSAQEAAAAFREALAIDPDLGLARVNLAIALLNVPDAEGALREARAALEARLDAPQPHFILGLALRTLARPEEAKAEFRRVLSADPRDVASHVNLGQILLQERSYAEAVAAFRAALGSEPWSATAAYNLGLALTRSGEAEEGARQLELFRALKDKGGTLIGQTYPDQGRYAEAIASTGAEADLVDAATPDVRLVDTTSGWLAAGAADVGPGRPLLFDVDADLDLDLFDIGPAGQRLLRSDGGRFVDVTTALGLDPSRGGAGAVAGDVDNDARPDLLVLRTDGVTLLRNEGAGLVDITSRAGLAAAGAARSAALADVDHDGDLDLVLGGWGAPDRLYQNAGDATFKDASAAAGLGVAGRVLAAVPTDYDNGRDIDLLEVVESGPPRLFRNRRDGSFQDVAEEAGLGAPGGLLCAAAGDVNKDGFTDFFLGADAGDHLALSDGRGRFALVRAPWGSSGSVAAQFLDYDGDGLLDLVVAAKLGVRVLRNLGSRFEDVTAAALGSTPPTALAFASGDLDGDGDTDLVLRSGSGLRLLRNDGGDRGGSLRVRLKGLVSNRSGVGAKVEMRAGGLRQKLETYAATPAPAPADVVFGLGGRGFADAVRVIWPAGILQTELGSAPAAGGASGALLEVSELNRKPSSCPYLYAWNGSEFAFVTDFMGGGEMGYYVAPGTYNVPDPLEYVRLTDAQLRPRDGRYELRVTNELEEALFVDRLALVAVDHAADVEVHPHEGMTSPPKPVRLLAVRGARPPRSAEDDHGHDVSDLVARSDRRYPDDFELLRIRGYAADHSLVLDLGDAPQPEVLLLTGWTDYAFSSDNVAAHQAGLAMRPPALEVQDASGRWHVAVPQVGIPVGRPQTVAVDLAGIWRGHSRRVRIATNMRIYWDEIRVGRAADGPLRETTLEAAAADLKERGFSAEVTPDGREPFGYDYARVARLSPWKAFPGRYTRPGDVRELLAATDDVFVVSRPGDELALSFDAAALPPLPEGARRTFLLLSDGFSKEMDINSATPDALGPRPFHAMSRYPYGAPEAFPMTEKRRRLVEAYETRVVRAPIIGLDAVVAEA